jgi:hypothetical protein
MKTIKYLVLVLLFCSPAFANIEAQPKEVLISVSNVPVNTPSLFIPLTLSSNDLDLYQIVLKDIFVRGYVASIERDEDKEIVGVSFASLRANTLPEKLEALIKVRPVKPIEKINGKAYPKSVQILWNQPWAYTATTKKLQDSYAGFNSLNLASNADEATTKQDLKRKKRQKEDRDQDFYIKSFGQPLVRSQRNNRESKALENYSEFPLIKEVEFFAITPSTGNFDKLYIPFLVEEPKLLQIQAQDPTWSQGVTVRVLENNLLEFVSLQNTNLPNKALISGKLVIKQSEKTLLNNIKVGPVLSEPSRPVAGVLVKITPGKVVIENDSLNPARLFKL